MEINVVNQNIRDYHRYIFVYNFNWNVESKSGKGITVKNIGASEFSKRDLAIGRWKPKK